MDRSLNRRSLLAGAAALRPLAAGAQMKKGLPVTDPQHPPIIDTHQHLWDLGRFRLDWLSGAPKIRRNFVMSDYLEATRGLNVVKAVYMEVDVDPAQQAAEAEHLIEICRRDDNPTVAAVISGRPDSEGFRAYVTRFKGSPYIKGVRRILHPPDVAPGTCLRDAFLRGVRLLGELGLSFDICIRGAEVGDAVKLVAACPGTRFILDHCGNPGVQTPDLSRWRRDIADLARLPNVVCKISGIIASAKPETWKAEDLAPIVRHCMDEFGPDRVMFGGDWPVCLLTATYREWVVALRQIVADRKPEERRKLFHDNAARFYGI